MNPIDRIFWRPPDDDPPEMPPGLAAIFTVLDVAAIAIYENWPAIVKAMNPNLTRQAELKAALAQQLKAMAQLAERLKKDCDGR